MSTYVLHDFPRSSACYRVRIALALKGIAYERTHIDIRAGDQRESTYLDVNAAGLVPALRLPDGTVLKQSLAILRFLDQVGGPRLFPINSIDDARVSAMAMTVACDIHPLNNLRVLSYMQDELMVSADAKSAWYAHWVQSGLNALEIETRAYGGKYCYGDEVSAADICLVPQLANARRFGVDLKDFTNLVEIDQRLTALPAFEAAAPGD
ncbi:MAG: maleylacetoacetate isomerase [Sphingopyxis sp.]|nr:maleylacetoacetate isomerase [Sphingopyxis sp.]